MTQQIQTNSDFKNWIIQHRDQLTIVSIVVGMVAFGLFAAGMAMCAQNDALKGAIAHQARVMPTSPQILMLAKMLMNNQSVANVLWPTGLAIAAASLVGGCVINAGAKGPIHKTKWVALGALALLSLGVGMMIGHGLWTGQKIPPIWHRSVVVGVINSQKHLFMASVNLIVWGSLSLSAALLYMARQRAQRGIN